MKSLVIAAVIATGGNAWADPAVVGDIDISVYAAIDSAQSDLYAIVRKHNADGTVVCLGQRGVRLPRSATATLVELSGPVVAHFAPGAKLELVLTNDLFPLNVRNANAKGVTIVSSKPQPSRVRLTYR